LFYSEAKPQTHITHHNDESYSAPTDRRFPPRVDLGNPLKDFFESENSIPFGGATGRDSVVIIALTGRFF
jgi:hypothetical protein